MKFILGVIFGVMVVIFILQNTDIVVINFLFWTIQVSRALMIFLVFLSGIAVGAISMSFRQKMKAKKIPKIEEAAQEK